MNSGITAVVEHEKHFMFFGASGSGYLCNKASYGLSSATATTWAQLEELHGDKVSLMEEETDWMEMDWLIE